MAVLPVMARPHQELRGRRPGRGVGRMTRAHAPPAAQPTDSGSGRVPPRLGAQHFLLFEEKGFHPTEQPRPSRIDHVARPLRCQAFFPGSLSCLEKLGAREGSDDRRAVLSDRRPDKESPMSMSGTRRRPAASSPRPQGILAREGDLCDPSSFRVANPHRQSGSLAPRCLNFRFQRLAPSPSRLTQQALRNAGPAQRFDRVRMDQLDSADRSRGALKVIPATSGTLLPKDPLDAAGGLFSKSDDCEQPVDTRQIAAIDRGRDEIRGSGDFGAKARATTLIVVPHPPASCQVCGASANDVRPRRRRRAVGHECESHEMSPFLEGCCLS